MKRCPTPYKKGYTKREAQEHRNAQHKHGRLTRIYACSCGKWHLTKKL